MMIRSARIIINKVTGLSDLTLQKIVTIQRTVLFGDCDPEGFVYTPRFSYFSVEAIQDALSIWLADKPKDPTKKSTKSGGLRKLMDHGILPPARAFSLEFHHPVTWDDELCVSRENHQSMPLPNDLRDRLSALLI